MSRIGVFLCYCGSNIAGTVDVEAVAEMARTLPDVVYVETNKYTCSDPGQEGVKNAIIEQGIDRVVVGACSPRMHESTWRKLLADTPVNPYMLEVANLREQCSWVHKDREIATEKAKDLVKMAVAKVARRYTPPRFPSTRRRLSSAVESPVCKQPSTSRMRASR